MRDVDQVIESLARRGNLSALKLNASGVAELVFDEDIAVLLIKKSESELEFAVYLDGLGTDWDAHALRALLHANHLGDAVGAGRVALDPEDDRFLFCKRVNVSRLDEDAFENDLLDFVRHAAFWRSDSAKALLCLPAKAPAATPIPQLEMLRLTLSRKGI